MLFIGTEIEIEEIPFDEEKPDFYLERISVEFEPVQKVFESPYVYYAGTSQGCGCGFNTMYRPQNSDSEAYQTKVLNFSKYLARMLGKSKQWEEKREKDKQERLLNRAFFISQINHLLDIVESQINKGRKVEMYSCWAGDYDSMPEYNNTVDFKSTLIRESFRLEERELTIFK